MFLDVISWAIGLFLIFFCFQILLSRLFRPTSEDKFIIFLFVIIPFVGFLGTMGFYLINDLELLRPVLVYLLFFVISSSWVASYPAVYAICPTLVISYVAAKKAKGTDLKELRQILGLKENSVDRIEDAIHDKWIRKNGTQVELTGIGRAFYLFFRTFRQIIGLKLETL